MTMEPSTQKDETLRVSQQAAQWLSTLEEGRPQDRQAFVDWLRRSTLHVQEFLILTAIDRYLDHVPADYPLDVAKLRASHSERVAAFPPPKDTGAVRQSIPARQSRKLLQRQWFAGMAAALAIVALGLWGWKAMSGQHYTTGIGEQRAIELPDGSVIHLNAQSRVDVRLSNQTRDVHLVSGEALFKVKQDRVRPFKVYSGDAVIQAVGTEFNVYRHERETTVAVLEGTVRISNESNSTTTSNQNAFGALRAGEEARLAPTGQISMRKNADVARAVAWRQRRLIFDTTPLPEIAGEFNRYNRRPQLRIEGEAARSRRFTGVFDADDPESLVALLEKDNRLAVQWVGNELVIRPKSERGGSAETLSGH
jgi:transmembrane sensor